MYALVQLHLINNRLLQLLTVKYTKATDNFLCTFAIAYFCMHDYNWQLLDGILLQNSIKQCQLFWIQQHTQTYSSIITRIELVTKLLISNTSPNNTTLSKWPPILRTLAVSTTDNVVLWISSGKENWELFDDYPTLHTLSQKPCCQRTFLPTTNDSKLMIKSTSNVSFNASS